MEDQENREGTEKKDPRLANLIEFKPGQSGNPNGRPKGRRSLATIIRELEEDEFDWSLVGLEQKEKELAQKIGNPWKAITLTALKLARNGDVKAMEWLRKSGYGDKLDLTSKGESIAPKIVSEIIPHVRTQTETE